MTEPTLVCCANPSCGAMRAPALVAECFCGATETKPAPAATRKASAPVITGADKSPTSTPSPHNRDGASADRYGEQ
jgi:hypothetical protein